MDTSVIGEKDNDPTGGTEVVSQALTSKYSVFVLEQRYSLWSTLPGCIGQPALILGLDLLTGACSDSNNENLFSKGTSFVPFGWEGVVCVPLRGPPTFSTPIPFICKPACRLLWELHLPGEPGAEVLTQPACVVLPFWKSTMPWADNVSHASVILNAKPRCQSLQVTHQDYAGRGSISKTPRTGSFSLDFGI